ncbi:MAG: hypothetical protein ABIQ44_09875 [Chloroflexia bacterium]
MLHATKSAYAGYIPHILVSECRDHGARQPTQVGFVDVARGFIRRAIYSERT